MKTYDLTLFIPTYKRYENVLNGLRFIRSKNILLKRICIVADKIIPEDLKSSDEILKIYRNRNIIQREFKDVQTINRDEHMGKFSMAHIPSMMDDEENCIVLEDDVVINENFLNQCEIFFKDFYTEESPMFIGYSKTTSTTNKFFKTYNAIPNYGITSKGKVFKHLIELFKPVRDYSVEEKRAFLDKLINKSYSCDVFEAYKKRYIEAISGYFLNRRSSALDVYIVLFLLSMNKKVVKTEWCNVGLWYDDSLTGCSPLRKREYMGKSSNVIELDILNSIYQLEQVDSSKKKDFNNKWIP